MVTLVQNDLEFILRQIKIAEAHSAGTPLTDIRVDADGNVVTTGGTLAISSTLLPNGLRTVDGSYNNLIEGREQWGASGQPFISLLTPEYRNEGDDAFSHVPGGNNDYGVEGSVVDADPRTISNLIVDQTVTNPAAISAGISYYAGLTGGALLAAVNAAMAIADLDARKTFLATEHNVEFQTSTVGTATAHTVFLPNVAPDEGLSASYNSWFTLFGQFFDHGLDLVKKGGSGTVYMPLAVDDPLYNPASPQTNFMALTRIDQGAPNNVTTPFVDQNQTYTSHASHQVFLREYAMTAEGPLATGRLLEGARGLATWGDVKEQARTMLGIDLTDADVGSVPLLRTDAYGEFIRGTNGYPEVIKGLGTDGIPNTADDVVESWDGVGALVSLADAFRTPNAFLDDIAHSAVPGTLFDDDGDPGTPMIQVQADSDDVAGTVIGTDTRGNKVAYDNELLDAHYITGDGRGNENIGLSAVHHVFHSEHNRVVDQVKEAALASGDVAFLNEWLAVDIVVDEANPFPTDMTGLVWDGERLFQAARFTTEMQYQHLVFEEFARKIQPDIDAFVFNPAMDINPAIFAEFAHVVYRFGHSMLGQTVESIDTNGVMTETALFDAFLNPISFGSDSITHEQAAGAIARGMTAQVGNEIDEFVTDVLRNQLVGIPLDLAALNIARARDAGIPALNVARRQFQEVANGDTQLDAYTSWSDFAVNLKNPASIVNFIAAYGTHETITDATTLADKRAAATKLVFGDPTLDRAGAAAFNADRLDFINARGAYAGGDLGGLEQVDLWVGGLAEKKMAFGGMLGSTFSFVFELQLENLQNGDRFYYLSRVQGLNLLNELENNSLAKMVLNNTDNGELDIAMPGDIFSVPNYVLYVDAAKQELFGTKAIAEPTYDDPWLAGMLGPIIERGDFGAGERYIRYNGSDHVVIGGTDDADTIIAGGGDDAVWGFDGDDRIEAGYGVDKIHGGRGDDIITNNGTDIGEVDMLHGEEGNDVIHGGSGLALIFGNQGQDAIFAGPDGKEVFGGTGDDFILGGEGGDGLLGNEGNDWIEGGNGFDVIAGDNSQLFFNSDIIGHDVMFAGQNEQDYDAESGDDIMGQGESVVRNEGMFGYDWGIYKGVTRAGDADLVVPIFTTEEQDILRNRFDQVEGLSGWDKDDVLRGDNRSNANPPDDPDDANDRDGVETRLDNNELSHAGVDRIDGLRALLGDLIGAAPTSGDLEKAIAFDDGNILLGGGGSDTIEGRGGNDVIDGDAWLNVRIAIAGQEGRIVDSLVQIQNELLNGTINPGDLSIVREILYAPGLGDVAVFSDVQDNYTVTANTDGSFTVEHDDGGVDGIDRLRNIEVLRFLDGDVMIGGLVAGLPLSDLTPTELQPLTVSLFDADGIVASTVTWEVSTGGGWMVVDTGTAFTPSALEVGQQLRVSASYTDALGFTTFYSPVVTSVVGDYYVGDNAINTPTLTQGADYALGLGQNDVIIGLGGDDTMFGGAGLDSLIGGEGSDYLIGEARSDTLDGGVGADFMDGGAGNDIFFVDDAGDAVIEAAGQGTDVVRTTLTTYTLAANVENLAYLGSQTFVGTGNALANLITGGNGDNTLIGLDGADRLHGMGGNDNLVGGSGEDTLFGSIGNDTLDGGLGDDSLVGGMGNDTLDGGLGADNMVGGLGSDRFIVDDAGDIVVDGGGGIDTVEASISAYTLTASVETLIFTGTGAFTGYGNTLRNTMIGGAGDDVIHGFGGADSLLGGEGGDDLYGGVGNDTLRGGAGADSLFGEAGYDTIEGGEGDDTLSGGIGGQDRFIFGTNFGNDFITDFGSTNGAGQDRMDVSALGITSLAGIAVTDLGVDGTLLTFGGGTVTLEGVAAATIGTSDFLFAA